MTLAYVLMTLAVAFVFLLTLSDQFPLMSFGDFASLAFAGIFTVRAGILIEDFWKNIQD